MVNVTLIAATDMKGCIGKGNKLPWKCRSEMEYFLKRVLFKPIVMGKNTCMSLKKPINSTPNYVLTRDSEFKRDGFITVNSIDEMLEIMSNGKEHIVAGGEQIYRQFLELASEGKVNAIVELSVLDTIVEDGDAYFPLDILKWGVDYTSQIIYQHRDNEMKWHVQAYYRKR